MPFSGILSFWNFENNSKIRKNNEKIERKSCKALPLLSSFVTKLWQEKTHFTGLDSVLSYTHFPHFIFLNCCKDTSKIHQRCVSLISKDIKIWSKVTNVSNMRNGCPRLCWCDSRQNPRKLLMIIFSIGVPTDFSKIFKNDIPKNVWLRKLENNIRL